MEPIAKTLTTLISNYEEKITTKRKEFEVKHGAEYAETLANHGEKKVALSEQREELKEEGYPEIFQKYGKIPDYLVTDILRAETQLEKCAKCAGLSECTSKWGRGYRYVIRKTNFGVCVPVSPCKFQREEEKQARFNKAFKQAKIPAQYIGKTFSDYEVTADNAAAVKAAKEFLQNPMRGLYFYGDPGTGKTFLVSIIAQEIAKLGKTVIFSDVPRLLEILRSSFDDKNTQILDLMDDLAKVDVLVLDDLGTEQPTPWAVERIFSIVNQRDNEKKPVIVTSNFRLGELARRLNNPKKTYGRRANDDDENIKFVTGNRIASRLALYKRVELKGKDRRIYNEFNE